MVWDGGMGMFTVLAALRPGSLCHTAAGHSVAPQARAAGQSQSNTGQPGGSS